ncbi:MAG: hypothetical protein ACI9QC_000272 [Oceanicoccus sp.]|jgi:hypothetical protein
MAKTKRREKRAVQTDVNPTVKSAFDEGIFGWYAPEFLRFERTWKWYLIAGLIDAALITYAVLEGSWSMALVFSILPLIYILEHKKIPKITTVVVSHWGIQYGDVKIPFTEIKGFWIHHHPPHVDELWIKTSSRIHTEVVIPLMGANPSLIRQYLVTQIPEWEGKHMPLLEVVARMLRLH